MSASLCPRALAALLALSFGNSGCGVLLQTAMGWNEEHTRQSQVRYAVEVEAPEGAEVRRRDPSGRAEVLGQGSLVDEVALTRVEMSKTPNTAGLWIGGLLSLAAGAGLVYASVNSTGDDCGFDEVCFDAGSAAQTTGYALGAAVAVLGGLTDITIAFIYGSGGETGRGSRMEGTTSYTYEAELDGRRGEQTVHVPSQRAVRLELETPPALLPAPAPPPPLAPLPASPSSPAVGSVIAVMTVEDVNAGTDKALEPGLIENLGDQLRIFVAQNGAQTVDRSTQQRALKTQLDELKRESYAACYDDACQIELGKALAASHILRARITRFGARCVLNAELIDLKAEVTVKAASARGGCAAEGFLTMAEQVASGLFEG